MQFDVGWFSKHGHVESLGADRALPSGVALGVSSNHFELKKYFKSQFERDLTALTCRFFWSMNALQFRHALCTAAAAVCSMLTAVVGSCQTPDRRGGPGHNACLSALWHTGALVNTVQLTPHPIDQTHSTVHPLCTFAAHCTMHSPRRSGAHPRRSADPWQS